MVKTFAVTEKTHFRRRVEHGGLRTERVKRLEELELEDRNIKPQSLLLQTFPRAAVRAIKDTNIDVSQ